MQIKTTIMALITVATVSCNKSSKNSTQEDAVQNNNPNISELCSNYKTSNSEDDALSKFLVGGEGALVDYLFGGYRKLRLFWNGPSDAVIVFWENEQLNSYIKVYNSPLKIEELSESDATIQDSYFCKYEPEKCLDHFKNLKGLIKVSQKGKIPSDGKKQTLECVNNFVDPVILELEQQIKDEDASTK